MGGGRGGDVSGTSNGYKEKVEQFYKPFFNFGFGGGGVGDVWVGFVVKKCLVLFLGAEYLLGYVLIGKKNSSAIFTPRNKFSCNKFLEPWGLSGEPLYNWT